jgi:long-chain fatty acid transport protein
MNARVLAATASICAVASFADRGHAAAFATARFGAEHGNPTESNPTALYYNPGGIGFSRGTHLYADGSLALRRNTWTHQKSGYDVDEPPGAEGANYGTAKLFNVFAGPALGATTKLGDLAIGAGMFVPFGGRAKWDRNEKFANSADYPLAVDGVQRWHGIDGQLTFLYLTAGAAYKIGPISIGASGNFIFSSVKSTLAKTVALGDNDVTQEARSAVNVSARHGSFALGVLFEAIEEKLWLGASYQAQPALGEMKLKGTLTASSAGETREDKVDFFHSLPEVIRFGGRFRPSPDLELRLFGDFTRWSRMVQQCIALEGRPCGVKRDGSPGEGTGTITNLYRGWSDTVGVRAGASRWFSPEVEILVGAGFETSAVPDTTLDPSLFDSTTISGALGGRFEIFDRLWLATTYTHIQYLNRDLRGKSILDDPTVHPTTRRVSGDGRYTSWVGVLNVNIEKQF